MGKEEERFLLAAEVAKILRSHISLVREEIKAGHLPAVKVGRSFLIEAKDLEAYLKARKVVPECASK